MHGMEETIAQDLFNQGYAKGYAKGVLRGYRKVLRNMLARRFDPLPDAVLQRIEAATDLARLKAALDRVDEITSLDELELP
jgi:hypothetical protein